VLTVTIRGEFNPDHLIGQFILFLILFYLIFGIFNFIPLSFSYLIDLFYQRILKKPFSNFKLCFNFMLYGFAILFSWWAIINGVADEISLYGWIAGLVFVVTFAVPMMVPIMQPKKMLRLAVYFLVLCFIGFGSYWIQYYKSKMQVERDGRVNYENSYAITLKKDLRKSCENSLDDVIDFARLVRPQLDAEELCKCLSDKIVGSASLDSILALTENFDNEEIFIEEQLEVYAEECRH